MESSLSAFWNRWRFPFRNREEQSPPWKLRALRLPIFGFSAAPVLWLELRFFICCLLVAVLYMFAGETGNQWFYMLAGGIIAALLLGLIMPFIAVLDAHASCTLPPHAVRNERVPLKLTLSRRGILGLFPGSFRSDG